MLAKHRAIELIALVLILSLQAFYADAQDKASPPPTAASAPSQAPSDPDYLGPQVCEACHEDLYKGWEKSPHWKTTLDTKGGPSHQGCEGCHGPGLAHLTDAQRQDKNISFSGSHHEGNQCALPDLPCLRQGAHGRRKFRAHEKRCQLHLLPFAAPCGRFRVSAGKNAAGTLLHLPRRSRNRSSICRFTIASMKVSSSAAIATIRTAPSRPKQVRTSAAQDVVCYTCHAEKRGPFVFEHEVVKVEGCESCHSPHGSPNAHMLKVSNVNILCLSCHTTSFANAPGAPSFHNQAAQYQSCTLCHSQIHGSNFDHTFFK